MKAGVKPPYRTWVKLERDDPREEPEVENIDYVQHAITSLEKNPEKPVIFGGSEVGIQELI